MNITTKIRNNRKENSIRNRREENPSSMIELAGVMGISEARQGSICSSNIRISKGIEDRNIKETSSTTNKIVNRKINPEIGTKTRVFNPLTTLACRSKAIKNIPAHIVTPNNTRIMLTRERMMAINIHRPSTGNTKSIRRK